MIISCIYGDDLSFYAIKAVGLHAKNEPKSDYHH